MQYVTRACCGSDNHDDDDGGTARRAAADARAWHRFGVTQAARADAGRRVDRQSGADSIHHARDLSVPGSPDSASPLVRRQRVVIESHAIEQHLIVRILPDRLQPRIVAQEDEAVRTRRNSIVKQGCLLYTSDAADERSSV